MPDPAQAKSWIHPRYSLSEPNAPCTKRTPYVELQVTSNFSFLCGASHPEEYFARAAELGYHALALGDRHTLAGIVRAHLAAKEHGLKLLVASTVEVLSSLPPDPSTQVLCRVLLFPTSRAAYGRLCTLLTLGKRRAEKGNCYLTLTDICEQQQELVAILIPPSTLKDFHSSPFPYCAQTLKDIFGDDRLSLALSRLYGATDYKRLRLLRDFSRSTAIPLVATNDVHYHTPQRRMLQDVLSCIRLGCTIEQAGRALFSNAERYLKSPQEMLRLFRRFPEATKRTLHIADQAASFSLAELRYQYPREIAPDGREAFSYLCELAWQGAAQRYPNGVPPAVKQQIEHELQLIHEMDYAKYFLTVYDIVCFARLRGILCQGRGAAANSAVCYSLGITAVDPERINILFERFISKERDEAPDIDIDFEHERREEVFQYIYEKYGRERAALVCEVITYRRRSAVRDVGKALGLSLGAVNLLSKSLHHHRGHGVFAEQFTAHGWREQSKTLNLVVSLSNEMIGFPRHLSQHVGGFIVTDEPLSQLVPIENAAMAKRTVIEWDKDDIEAMGILKIDLLALGMLSCIRRAFELINTNILLPAGKAALELHSLPAEDPLVYDMICRAETIGVFQIESRAQMSMLPRLKPRNYYDLVIEVAIVRPGPIQGNMVHPYLRRRSGKEAVYYPDKKIEAVLSRTLGVPLFQEQAMALAIVGAGFSGGEADKLRRAMAAWKSKSNLIETFEQRLIEGMKRNGYNEAFARSCFEQLKGFSEYGFPESHAASFALLVYASAWLKCHYPLHFACALLNSQPMGFYQPAQIIQDLKRRNLSVRPIDVNYSFWDCSVEDDNQALRLGFRLICGIHQHELQRLLAARPRGTLFTSLRNVLQRSGVSLWTLKQLARADAFSSLGLSRQRALWELRRFRDKSLPLLEHVVEQHLPLSLPPLAELQQVFEDYRHFGLSLKGHPLSFFRKALKQYGALSALELQDCLCAPQGKRVVVAGLVLVRQRPYTASGVMFITMEDESGQINLIVRPSILEKYRKALFDAAFLLVRGRVERVEGVIHLLVEEAFALGASSEALQRLSRDFR